MALNVLYQKRKPDFILSGINHGYNGSAAVIYSGTVASHKRRRSQQHPVYCF